MKIRLDKILANGGLGSRKEVNDLISEGRVKVDGLIVTKGKTKVKEDATIEIDTKVVDAKPYVYYLLYKPPGYISASRDRRETVIDLIDPYDRRKGLFPVGRLDFDTSGLVMITNDGRLAHKLLSPKKHIPKKYLAQLDLPCDSKDMDRFEQGIMLVPEGKLSLPAHLEILDDNKAIVTIKEGKYHQVKRMFGACGKKVLKLKRLSMGPLELGNLKIGEYRKLEDREIENLKAYLNS